MMDELLNSVTQLRSDAQDLRRQARAETNAEKREQLFGEAVAEFKKAIGILERSLRLLRRQESAHSNDVCRVLEELSKSCGSLGGTWRDSGDLDQAIEQYDKGNSYEQERREHCGAQDTYNMLQRLIVRLLRDPARMVAPEFLAELQAVRQEIESQVKAGREDSWGLADMVLVRFLCDAEADADAAIANLDRRKADASFYESAYKAVAALVAEGLGKGSALGERLESFARFLQRKGGLA